MNKITRLLLIFSMLFSIKGIAQNITCNAAFTTQFQNGSTVNFIPAVPGDAIHHKWYFGDGAIVSGVISPSHTYLANGTYTASHVVAKYNPNGVLLCKDSVTRLITIADAPCNIQAAFTSQTSQDPLHLFFINTTVNLAATDSVFWNFGDGHTSTAVNPDHTYSQGGTYNVCLRVKRNLNSPTPCVSEICHHYTVTPACTLVADFSSTIAAVNPLLVEFHNLSAPLDATDSIRWTFGDGTGSMEVNPHHTYAQPGTYTVCLRVKKNGITNCVREICKTLVVPAPTCNITASFTAQADPQLYRRIIFTNTSSTAAAAATATWTFGDGGSASSWNATHEYANAGTYVVCLRVQSGVNCVREKCETVIVHAPVPPCNLISSFTTEPFPNDRQSYHFTPTNVSTALHYTWTFGDGTGSNVAVTTHHYAHAGAYAVCLTVSGNPGCTSTTCKNITVQPQINCDSVHVSYSYQRSAAYPNKLYFYANSATPILDQTWTFTKIPGSVTQTLHQNNPSYIFSDTGSYQVCLRAVTSGGCVKEYCSVIHIEHVTGPGCELQAFPNPANAVINVNVLVAQPVLIHAYIYNSANVLVKDKTQQGSTGNNLVTMEINNLVAGPYTIKLVYGNNACYARFQKL